MDWFVLDEIARISAGMALAVLGLVVYFLPTIIAWRSEHPSAFWIFLINLFAGIAIVGWVVAFVWAVFPQQPQRSQ